jgi:hypothetical protein
MIALPHLLPPSNILPPRSPHCASNAARKNSASFSKVLFHLLNLSKLRKSETAKLDIA